MDFIDFRVEVMWEKSFAVTYLFLNALSATERRTKNVTVSISLLTADVIMIEK